MVICSLFGGIGNQMFQYACAYSLAAKLKRELLIDYSFYKSFKIYHPMSDLNNFFKIGEINNSLVSGKINLISKSILYQKFIVKLPYFNLFNKNIVNESNFNVKKIKKNKIVYLLGYFQSELFFNKKNILRKFNLNFEEGIDQSLKRKIQQSNSVSIHIRRGDYLSKKLFEKDITLPINYYKISIDYIKKKIPNPIFFIFSDDIMWVKNVLKKELPFIHIVDNSKYKNSPKIDFFLMSICKHNIIANSTYSWWAAWLNKNKSKIIIAPSDWKDKSPILKNNIQIPKSWVRL
jgi:hypothetical protein